jgi:hypothetical protein
MSKSIKFLMISLLNFGIFSKKILPTNKEVGNLQKKIINFQESNIPHSLREEIQDKYPSLNEEQQLNRCYFMLIIHDFFLNKEFTKVKDKFEQNKKENNFYYNYYLLLFLIRKNIITDKEELLKQQYKITSLENDVKFHLDILILEDITEKEFETINELMKEQQSKDFTLTNTFIKKYNHFISTIKKKSTKKITLEEVLLEGDYMNVISTLPKEFLAINNLLKKYHIWFSWQKRNTNSYNVGIIKNIEKLPPITYQEFITNLQNQLLLNEIHKIINNKTNTIYKINNKLPLEVLDEEIFNYLVN